MFFNNWNTLDVPLGFNYQREKNTPFQTDIQLCKNFCVLKKVKKCNQLLLA